MTFDQWYRYGIINNWVGPAVCAQHDGIPTSLEEEVEWEEGSDPCLFIMRLYNDPQHATEVEENHDPSAWRRPIDL